MAKRFQVFVSSTYEDLRDERDFVIKAILDMGHIPVGMEMFSAADEEQWQTIKREIDNSDYYLVIIAHRYGSMIEEEGWISYTEKEYDYAVAQGVPRIGFVISPDADWKRNRIDEGDKAARLEAFKAKVKGRPVDFWGDKQQLATRVAIALPKLIANTDRPGWERGTEGGKQVAETISRLSDENARLQAELDRLKALAAENIPQLDCEFLGPDGRSLSRHIGHNPPPEDVNRGFIQENLPKINELIRAVDGISMVTSALLGDEGDAQNNLQRVLRASQPGFPYSFNSSRLEYVQELLSVFGADQPSTDWSFDFLRKLTIAMPGSYASQHPEAGLDLEKYKAFEKLETFLLDLEQACLRLDHLAYHRTIQLRLLNVGRAPAEALTVRVEFQEPVPIYLAAVSENKRPDTSADTRYFTQVDLIPAEDGYALPPFTIRLEQGVKDINFDVRVTGRSLPQAQVIPMSISIYELDDNDEDSAQEA